MRPTLYTESPTIKNSLREYSANGHKFSMIAIEKGSFLMQGDHQISFKESFELGQYPVTQALWEAVMGDNPSDFQGKNCPMEGVSWDDIMGTEYGVKQEGTKAGFLDRLNALPEIAALNEQDGGYRFALPSEAQWEYAARGGRYGAALHYDYAGSNYLPEVGWYDENSQAQTQAAGRKEPNGLGLCDMSGNVWEWCEDVWNDNLSGLSKDGSARITGDNSGIRVVRGGSWFNNGNYSTVSDRDWFSAGLRDFSRGFRLSRYRVTL